tara:strand:- start:260 stop:1261 length:1002 start_codon:yes stop_codon:yes gene_type:complete
MANILFQNALLKHRQSIPPIWFMRQAGRYHSHYRKLKEKYTFEQLCKSPELAAEVAKGPIDEFDFDVAILFSDILFILEGLGLELKFDPGPKFGSYINADNYKNYNNIDKAIEHLKFQSDAIKFTRESISNSKSLIGFVGGPWTLIRYAFGKDNYYNNNYKEIYFDFLSSTLVPLLKQNINLQLEAGAEIVMIFDSSLYDLENLDFKKNYISILEDISSNFPNKVGYYSRGRQETDLLPCMQYPFAGFGFDASIDLKYIFENSRNGFIQGNFNEKFMLLNTDQFKEELKKYTEFMKTIENRDGWVCGLGHGINKDTPEKNVHLFLENIRKEFS